MFYFITTRSLLFYFVRCLWSVSLSLSQLYRSGDYVDQVHYYFPVSRTCHDDGRFSINADEWEWVDKLVIHCRYILPVLNNWFARESYLGWIVCHSYSYAPESFQTGGLRLELGDRDPEALSKNCSDEGQTLAMRELGKRVSRTANLENVSPRCWGWE